LNTTTYSARFSGHESFHLRFGWLPKVYEFTSKHPGGWNDPNTATVGLGVGRNMVISMRFWAEALGILTEKNGKFEISPVGKALLSSEGGWDPYLERLSTLWFLHWRLVHAVGAPLFAWSVFFGRLIDHEWTRSQLVKEFDRIALGEFERKLSSVTLTQHLDVFLRTYVSPPSRLGIADDHLDSPLAELRLIETLGDQRRAGSDRSETVYSFRYGAKPELSDRVFLASLTDFWSRHRPNDNSLTFKDVASAPLGPGRVFCLSENDLRDRLERLVSLSRGAFDFASSGLTESIYRKTPLRPDVDWKIALMDRTMLAINV
jgi:hypothetical protein